MIIDVLWCSCSLASSSPESVGRPARAAVTRARVGDRVFVSIFETKFALTAKIMQPRFLLDYV